MMKPIPSFLAGLFLLFSGSSVIYASGDGNELLRNCNNFLRITDGAGADIDSGAAMWCAGMMIGVRTTLQLWTAYAEKDGRVGHVCVPQIPNGQAARIVVKYLNEHPSELHEGDVWLVIDALKDAFPCDSG